MFAKLFGVKAPFSSKVIAQNPKRNGVGNTKIELKISNEPHSLIVQQVTRGQGPDGWGDVLVPSIYQPPQSLISDLLSTANLSLHRPLFRSTRKLVGSNLLAGCSSVRCRAMEVAMYSTG